MTEGRAIPHRPERRRAARLPVSALGDVVSVVGARLLNASRYGMLIESPVPMARDAVLSLRLTIAGQAADVEARVAQCNPQPGLRAYGVGLEFVRFDAADLERLERALNTEAR